MTKQNQVRNEVEADALSERIIKAAVYLANPLLEPAEKQRLMRVYDEMVRQLQMYNRARIAEKFPSLQRVYAELGWEVGEIEADTPLPAADTEPARPQQEPQPQPEPEAPKAAVNLSSWLDD